MFGIIVAAGEGRRLGAPKALLPLAGRPLLAWSLRAFEASGVVDRLVVVAREEDRSLLAALTYHGQPITVAPGGPRRQDSVLSGLKALGASTGRVLVHDAARPLITPDLIRRVAAAPGAAAVPVVAAYDTLKRKDGDRILGTLDRSVIAVAQTPQAFDLGELRAQLEAAPEDVTDEASLFEAAGLEVTAVEGDLQNFKITERRHLEMAEAILGQPDGPGMLIGHGYDIHPTVLGKGPLTLGGVEIPSDVGLAGHSDADVLLHAVADALLGAAGLPDIGHYFPPQTPETKGMDSREIVRTVVREIGKVGLRPWQVDTTVVAEAPKIGPHRDGIRASLAELLGVAISRVNVKATTEEGLDDVGQGLGIRAWAVAVLVPLQSG